MIGTTFAAATAAAAVTTAPCFAALLLPVMPLPPLRWCQVNAGAA